jgi:hypothetical protein
MVWIALLVVLLKLNHMVSIASQVLGLWVIPFFGQFGAWWISTLTTGGGLV